MVVISPFYYYSSYAFRVFFRSLLIVVFVFVSSCCCCKSHLCNSFSPMHLVFGISVSHPYVSHTRRLGILSYSIYTALILRNRIYRKDR